MTAGCLRLIEQISEDVAAARAAVADTARRASDAEE